MQCDKYGIKWKGLTCSFIWVIFQSHRFLFSIIFSEKTCFLAKFMFFSKKKCSTFGSHFYTLVIVLLCIFWLKLSNKGSIFLHLKVLHDTLFSYVFYYLVKYCVFGRTNCNACYRNACYRLFHCLLKKFNLHYWFCSSIINLSTVLDYSVNKFVANLLVWGQTWNEV